MSCRVSPSTNRTYGLQRVARIWGVSRATVYRHRCPSAGERRRPGPIGAMADEDLVRAIRKLLTDSPFHGEGHRKLWARLRFAGIRTSRRRVLRLMRAHGLLAHQRAGRARGPKAHDGTITTERVDLMWGTDMTSMMTGEGQAAVFIAVDHCSAECLGIHASRGADRFEALEPVRQAVRRSYGAFGRTSPPGCGSATTTVASTSATTSRRIRFLGLESSPAFVREPEGNGCAERFIRTLKENLLWVRPFDTIEELRLALQRFRETLQPELDHRATRLQDAGPGPGRSARPGAHGRMSANRCLTTVDRYTAVFCFLTLVLLTPLFRGMPHPALGAIVIAAMLHLTKPGYLRDLFVRSRWEFAVTAIVFAGELTLGVLQGIGLGVALSLIMLVYWTTHPQGAVLGQLPGVEAYRDVARHPDAVTFPGLLIWRPGGDLFFASIGHVGEALKAALATTRPAVRHVLIDADSVNLVDTTALDALLNAVTELQSHGTTVAFARVRDQVRERMQLAGVEAAVGAENFHERVTDGVRAWQARQALR